MLVAVQRNRAGEPVRGAGARNTPPEARPRSAGEAQDGERIPRYGGPPPATAAPANSGKAPQAPTRRPVRRLKRATTRHAAAWRCFAGRHPPNGGNAHTPSTPPPKRRVAAAAREGDAALG